MVSKKTKGLGMGLEALLGPKVQESGNTSGSVSVLQIEHLRSGEYQPRTRMDEGALYELAESIRSQGIMQPVLVRQINKSSSEPRYEIIAGERRVRAAKLAGLSEVPALIRNVGNEAAAAMALIENMQREDLNPLEEAQGLQRLISEFGLSHEAAAKAVGRSRSTASNLLRLLNLAKPVQTMLMAGDLEMGHARALLALERAQQIGVANEVVNKRLSVRQAEKLVQQATGSTRKTTKVKKPKSADLRRLEEELSDHLLAPVEIRIQKRTKWGDQGELTIGFGSLDELDGILIKLRHGMPPAP